MSALLGICPSLVGLFAINRMASLLFASLWRGISRTTRSWPCRARV